MILRHRIILNCDWQNHVLLLQSLVQTLIIGCELPNLELLLRNFYDAVQNATTFSWYFITQWGNVLWDFMFPRFSRTSNYDLPDLISWAVFTLLPHWPTHDCFFSSTSLWFTFCIIRDVIFCSRCRKKAFLIHLKSVCTISGFQMHVCAAAACGESCF